MHVSCACAERETGQISDGNLWGTEHGRQDNEHDSQEYIVVVWIETNVDNYRFDGDIERDAS